MHFISYFQYWNAKKSILTFSSSKSVQIGLKLILARKLHKRRTGVFHIKFSILECQKVNFNLFEFKKCSNRSEINFMKKLHKSLTYPFHIKFSILECQNVNFDLFEVKKCSNRSEINFIKKTAEENVFHIKFSILNRALYLIHSNRS